MKISPEILNLLEKGNILSIEITYPKGGKVLGTIKKFKLVPIDMVLEKIEEGKQKSAKHHVVMDHITEMKINLMDGTSKQFK